MEPVTTTLCAPDDAVEAAVSVTVAVVPGTMDAGLMLAVTPVPAFTVSVTAFLAEPLSVTATVKVDDLPARSEPDVADCVSAKLAPAAGVEAVPQPLTSSAPSTDPKPVARL